MKLQGLEDFDIKGANVEWEDTTPALPPQQPRCPERGCRLVAVIPLWRRACDDEASHSYM